MKQLNLLTSPERAALLHQLFPDEINAFVAFLHEYAEQIRNNSTAFMEKHGEYLPFKAELWIALADDMCKRIPANGTLLIKNHRRFADQLFDGLTALFTIQAMQEYAAACDNSHFILAMELLFRI